MRCLAVVISTSLLIASASAWGEDFRIESRVYSGKEESPAYRNLTLFQRHVVYDFLDGPASETTIYEGHTGSFTLLDAERKVKTTLDRETLGKFVAGIKVLAGRGNSLIREAAEPKFDVSYDERLQRVNLAGNLIHYSAQGQPFVNERVAATYREFVDMYTRLNATQPNSLPPFARLELNAALAERGLCPTLVERKILSKGPLANGELIVRSEHTIAGRILANDQKRIDLVSRQRAEFETVDFGKYRRIETSQR